MARALVVCGILTAIITGSAIALPSSTRADDVLDRLVSLIQIIANPNSFDQKKISVKGYAVLEFESKALYVNELDAKHGVTRNAVWLAVNDAIYAQRARFHRRWVFVEGTFNAAKRGHLGLTSGSIEDITRIEVLD